MADNGTEGIVIEKLGEKAKVRTGAVSSLLFWCRSG